MPFVVTYNPDTNVIETVVDGEVTVTILMEIFETQARTAADTGCMLMLNDYRRAVLALSTLDIYHLPKLIADVAAAHGTSAFRTRRALVIARDSADYRFYETVTANNAQTERLFTDIDEARAWISAAHP